ncbi:MAG TPA: hypothetical protein VFL93_01200 [Longimicrobiaceae bacterium]|nr:hypothetical protein [Longimicrobiaceae bacterium]
MRFVTVVKLVLAGSPAGALPNVRVSLFDHDNFSRDDLIGTAMTDARGEARFDYTTESFADLDEKLGAEFPDLYAVAYDAQGREVASTRGDIIPNTARKTITLSIARDVAQQHELLPAMPA